jgi:hypothetical protein
MIKKIISEAGEEIPVGAEIEDYPETHEVSGWDYHPDYDYEDPGDLSMSFSGPRPSTLEMVKLPDGWGIDRVIRSPVEAVASAYGVDEEMASKIKDYWHGRWSMMMNDREHYLEGKRTFRLKRGEIKKIIREELSRAIGESVTPEEWTEEAKAAREMAAKERGPRAVKKMKDYEDGIHTGVASLVGIIGEE